MGRNITLQYSTYIVYIHDTSRLHKAELNLNSSLVASHKASIKIHYSLIPIISLLQEKIHIKIKKRGRWQSRQTTIR